MDIKDLESIQLKSIDVNDYNLLDRFYNMRRPQTSDSNLLNLFLWRNCYPTWYFTTSKGLVFVAKSEDRDENVSYYSTIPCCAEEDLQECFDTTQQYFNHILDKKLTMYVVDKQAIERLNLPGEEYVVVRDRSYDDYIYDAEKLRTFSGRKYHKKKNHLNAFLREYDGRYEFKELGIENKEEILAFLDRWIKGKKDAEQEEYIEYESIGINEVLENWETIQFKMAGVYIDGVLEAFTIGNYYSQEDMVYVPVEKANPEIRGLYAFICSEFLKVCFPEAGKVNREDDMGIEGLRQAKMSLNPIYMIEKYTIIQK